MAYRFQDQKPGDILELPNGQFVIKTDLAQALCLLGNDIGLLLDIPPTADVNRKVDREDVVQLVLGDY